MRKIKIPDVETQEYIRENYTYNKDYGTIDGASYNDIGSKHKRNDGKYVVRVKIRDRNYRRAHLAWFLHYGRWPESEIDHIDRDQLNDKIDNLKEVTTEEQQANKHNYGGYKGFSVEERKDKVRSKPWRVRSQAQGIELGNYESVEIARGVIDVYWKERGEDWKWGNEGE